DDFELVHKAPAGEHLKVRPRACAVGDQAAIDRPQALARLAGRARRAEAIVNSAPIRGPFVALLQPRAGLAVGTLAGVDLPKPTEFGLRLAEFGLQARDVPCDRREFVGKLEIRFAECAIFRSQAGESIFIHPRGFRERVARASSLPRSSAISPLSFSISRMNSFRISARVIPIA